MTNVKLNLKNSQITKKEIAEYKEKVENIHKELHNRANDEKDFVGWLELPTNYDQKEFERIKKAAKKIKKESDILVVIGIGGSYLGARAVIESLTSTFYNMLPSKQRKNPEIVQSNTIHRLCSRGTCSDRTSLSYRRTCCTIFCTD